jgi:hypothetical protein
MDRVNVVVMIALIAAITLMLTPVLSPYRLTADSQDHILRAGRPKGATEGVKWRNDIIRELRFDAGEYGKGKLRTLAADRGLPRDVIQEVIEAQAENYPRYGVSAAGLKNALATLPIYPKGRTLPSDLAQVIEHLESARLGLYLPEDVTAIDIVGVFVDLTGDQSEDFAILIDNRGAVFEHVGNAWRYAGPLAQYGGCQRGTERLLDDMEAGRFATRVPRMAELVIGARHYLATPVSCLGDP